MFNQLVLQFHVAGFAAQGRIDMPPGAAGSTRSRRPDIDLDTLLVSNSHNSDNGLYNN